MDPRLYHYQYRRPRFSNPTYSSFNVSGSMTFFMNPKNLSPSPIQPKNRYEQPQNTPNINPYYSNNQRKQIINYQPPETTRESNSHLSNYGNNSLAFNQREIYDKQHSKYNIINLKPREIPDHIKQYPRLTLEDKDIYYYQRVQKMRDIEQEAAQRSGSMPYRNSNVAGKQTFMPEDGKNSNYYQHSKYFTPKLLNHADEVGTIL